MLSTLNEIIIDDSKPSNDQVGRYKQSDPDKGSTALFRTVHSNHAPVAHSKNIQDTLQQKIP